MIQALTYQGKDHPNIRDMNQDRDGSEDERWKKHEQIRSDSVQDISQFDRNTSKIGQNMPLTISQSGAATYVISFSVIVSGQKGQKRKRKRRQDLIIGHWKKKKMMVEGCPMTCPLPMQSQRLIHNPFILQQSQNTPREENSAKREK